MADSSKGRRRKDDLRTQESNMRIPKINTVHYGWTDIWGNFFQEYSSKIWEQDEQNRKAVKDISDMYSSMVDKLQEIASCFNVA